jgi:hypothetical protein
MLLVCLLAPGALSGHAWPELAANGTATPLVPGSPDAVVFAAAGAALALLLIVLFTLHRCGGPHPRLTPPTAPPAYPDHAYIVLAS